MDKSSLKVVSTTYEIKLNAEEEFIIREYCDFPDISIYDIDGVLMTECLTYDKEGNPYFKFTIEGCCEEAVKEVIETLDNFLQKEQREIDSVKKDNPLLKLKLLKITKKEAQLLIENDCVGKLVDMIEGMKYVHKINLHFESAHHTISPDQTYCDIEVIAEEEFFDSTFILINLLVSSTLKKLK